MKRLVLILISLTTLILILSVFNNTSCDSFLHSQKISEAPEIEAMKQRVPKPFSNSDSHKYWVNFFDSNESGLWLFTGDSPYLHDDKESYIQSLGISNCSWFHFQDTHLATLQTVNLVIEWRARLIFPGDDVKLYLANGVTEQVLGEFNLTLEYTWTEINVTNLIDNTQKVNSTRLKISSLQTSFYIVQVRRAYLRIYNGPVPIRVTTQDYGQVGQSHSLSVEWSDPDGLSSFAFNHNASGTWLAENLTGTVTGFTTWTNYTVNLQYDTVSVLAYRFWANDTEDNWEGTDTLFVYPLKNFSPSLLKQIESVSGSPISHSYGRKDFFDNNTGRFWKFYSDGINMKYTSSEDGRIWETSQTIRSAEGGFLFYVHNFNGSVHYIFNSEQPEGHVYYRKGDLYINGTINWLAPEQAAVTAETSDLLYACSIVTDTSGFPYLLYGNRTAFNSKTLNLVRSEWKNGSWLTSEGFPLQVNENPDSDLISGVVLSLLNDEVFTIYCSAGDEEPPQGRLWNGTVLLTQENASDYTMSSNYPFSAVADNNGNVHLAFRRATSRIDYSFRNYSTNNWEIKDELISTYLTDEPLGNVIYSWPVIGWDQDSLRVFLHWWTMEDKSGWLKTRNSTAWGLRRRILRLNSSFVLIDGDVMSSLTYQNRTLINFAVLNVTDGHRGVWAYIYTNESPVSAFTESAETVYTNEEIMFNASESFDPDGTIVAYKWDFGDDTNATGINTQHSYTDNGNYTVTLTVVDDDGASSSSSSVKTVLNRPPVASFTESAATVYTGETISFNASGSFDTDGFIISCFWDFGDNDNATGLFTEHSYEEDGNFTVTLTVIDDDGESGSSISTKNILNRPPVAVFTESATTVLVGETITLNASTSYDPDGILVNYYWDFGDGANATGETTEHSYKTNGTFIISLLVTDDDGASGITVAIKTVLHHNIAVVGVQPSKTIVGKKYDFNITVTIQNQGDFVETFNITLYANMTLISTGFVNMLPERTTQDFTLIGNTSNLSMGNNSLSAFASLIANETDQFDNSLIEGWIFITLPGDLDGDRDVDIFDIVELIDLYGVSWPDPLYDPQIDIDNSGAIDIFDVVIAVDYYGQDW